MITIFNRRELASTCSMSAQAALRDALAAAGIDYRIRVIDRGGASMSRARTGAAGQNPAQYVIYVHKNDLERAKAALRAVRSN